MSEGIPIYYDPLDPGQIPIITSAPAYNPIQEPVNYTTTKSTQSTQVQKTPSTSYQTTDDGTQRMFLIFIIALILIVAIIIAVLFFTADGNGASTQQQAPVRDLPFGAACDSEHKCGTGLVCETTCKKALGQPCDSLAECTTAATTCTIGPNGQNVCKTGPVGGLDENCPCDPGLLCNDDGVCKTEIGNQCSIDADCISGKCNNGVCGHGAGLGEKCTTTADCDLELHCSEGICQQDGIETGDQGAWCCTTDQCNGNLRCVDNECAVTTQGLGDPCGNGLLCSPELVCKPSSARRCFPGVCMYPEDNRCSCKIACPLGMKCICGKCLGKSNAPCSMTSQCAFSSCNTSQGGLYTWNGNGWTLFALLPEIPTKIDVIPGDGETTLDTIWMVGPSGLWWYDRVNISGATWILAYENTVDWETTGRSFIQSLSTADTGIMVSGRIRAADLTVYTALFTTTMNIDGTVDITEFNTTNVLRPGEQYSTTDHPLVIQTFSVNPSLDIAIVAPDENDALKLSVYVKNDAETKYTLQEFDVNSPVSHYLPLGTNNTAVVNSAMTKVILLGDSSGISWPTDSDHIIVDQDIDDYETGRLLIVAKTVTTGSFTVFSVSGGVQFNYPGWFGPQSRVAVSPSAQYITSIGRCN